MRRRLQPGCWPVPSKASARPQVVGSPRISRARALLASVLLLAGAQPVLAQVPEIFRDADLKLGAELIETHKCVACHQRRVGGDGSSIYRPQGRINSAPFLRGMVEQCNTELNLGLFPEEVSSIAAVLNRDHYRFK